MPVDIAHRPSPIAPSAGLARGERRRWRLPIIWLLVLALPTLTCVAVASVLLLGLFDSRAYTHTLIRDRADTLLDSMVEALTTHLDPVETQFAAVAQEFGSGAIEVGDDEAIYRYLSGVLTAVPQVPGIGLARPDRRTSLFFRAQGHVVRERRKTSERARQWEDEAVHWVGGRWVEPLWTVRADRPAIMLLEPLRAHDETFVGILAVPVPLDALSRLLTSLANGFDQTPFVLFDRSRVLAHPLLQKPSDRLTPEHPILTLDELGDPVLAHIWDAHAGPVPADELPPSTEGRRVAIAGEPYIFMYRLVTKYGEAPWLVGSYFRESAVGAAEISRLMRLGMFGGAILVIAVLLSVACGRVLGRPIRLFARAAREVQNGNFALPQLGDSRIREFDEAGRAFNDMVDGLRERERIRDLFGKYVPAEVAETVLADPDSLELGGQKREITVLFSDIENFTAMSEGLSPDRVLALLNAYFDGVGRILVAHSGIIVDFVGDAVFAVFGAPIAHADHARRALAAAREVERFAQRFSAEHQARGLPFGATRIGVHTGIAIVGNIGSRDRLKYGAAGDVVNTAARLEGANKVFGSRILASAVTIRSAGDADARPMGSVIVKGRTAPVEVFEVLEPGASADPWHAQYLVAFEWLSSRAHEATDAIRRLVAERPDDRALSRLLDRLEQGVAGSAIELTEK